MKFINESIESSSKNHYNIDDTIIVTQYIDNTNCYAIGTIDMITITRDDVVYGINNSSANIRDEDILPYNQKSISELKSKGYVEVQPYAIM